MTIERTEVPEANQAITDAFGIVPIGAGGSGRLGFAARWRC
jgi:hypothetical protein